MTKLNLYDKPIRLSTENKDSLSLLGEMFPILIEQGSYKELWQSPQFVQANQLSKYLFRSAKLLKKHLPSKFHDKLRFTQNPKTIMLNVADKNIAKQLTVIFRDNYGQIMQDEAGLPQHVKLRQIYRNWQQAGRLLSSDKNLSGNSTIKNLCKNIPLCMHDHIRLQYKPSIWQLNVPKSVIATRLNPLLDELSILLARDMGFAPKLKVNVIPANWENSGVMLNELIKEKVYIPNEKDAEDFLANFLRFSIKC